MCARVIERGEFIFIESYTIITGVYSFSQIYSKLFFSLTLLLLPYTKKFSLAVRSLRPAPSLNLSLEYSFIIYSHLAYLKPLLCSDSVSNVATKWPVPLSHSADNAFVFYAVNDSATWRTQHLPRRRTTVEHL